MRGRARAALFVESLWIAVLWGAALYGAYSSAHKGEVRIETLSFDALAGWGEDDPTPAFAAFLRSCDQVNKAPPENLMGRSIRPAAVQTLYGHVSDWQEVCAVAALVDGARAPSVRSYFESFFIPVRIDTQAERDGLLTGYYEPQLHGSRTPSARYHVALRRRPADLITVDLGQFRTALRGERLSGKVVDHRLVPYAPRAVLDAAAAPRDAVVWVDDPVDAFFLHIQGGGRVVLDDGAVMRVGYAASNGRPYTAIGKILIQRGAVSKADMSMQAIRAWLEAHPQEAGGLLNANASYVFFRELKLTDPALGPPGAQGALLTPGRSVAVDRRFHALGAPVWVEGTAPLPFGEDGSRTEAPFQRLMVMQDTGGAIRGVMRADIFWGFGAAAESVAGRMKHRGRLTVLIPKHLAARAGTP